MSNSTVPPEIRALLDDVRDALSVTVDTMALDNLSRLESLYLEQLQEIERMDWLVGAYLGADFKYDYAGQEVSVLLIGIPKGARISNDFRETISALRGISTKGTAEK